jgi:hypothetical protein
MIQGGDEASKSERMVLQYRTRKAKTYMLGGISHSWDEQHRIIDRDLGSLGQCSIPIASKHIVYAEYVGQEDGIELPPLHYLGEVDPLIEVGVVGHMVVVSNPQAGRLVHHTVHIKGVKIDTSLHRISPLSSPKTRKPDFRSGTQVAGQQSKG